VATIVYILAAILIHHQQINSLLNFLHSVFYLSYFFGRYVTASHFWTLTVEWQFYFIVPFLLLYQNKIGFKKTFSIIFAAVLLTAIIAAIIFEQRAALLSSTIIFHGVEFAWGIVAARLLITNQPLIKSRILWLLAFIIITYAGRIFISKHILDLSPHYSNLFRLAGFTLLGLGFAGILYLSVTSVKWLNMLLGNKVFKTMGRISYSFYLWHELIYPFIAGYIVQHMHFETAIIAPLLSTFISALVLYPVSLVSYNLLEKPFLSIGNLTTK
jgi:peptidoglycan/LPS O-acetylase OafA/YrhL